MHLCPVMKPDKISDVTVLEPVKPVPDVVEDRGRVVVAGRKRRIKPEKVVLPGEPTQHDEDFGIVRRPLTLAERQKRHREKKGDAYRKANKLRMRRKRND